MWISGIDASSKLALILRVEHVAQTTLLSLLAHKLRKTLLSAARQWEWNYQPNAAMWLLRERPGYLRLYALPPLRIGHFTSIQNAITQRSLRTGKNQFTVKLDLAGMTTEQESGIAHFEKSHAAVSVVKSGTIRKRSVAVNGVRTPGPAVDGPTLWLRSD